MTQTAQQTKDNGKDIAPNQKQPEEKQPKAPPLKTPLTPNHVLIEIQAVKEIIEYLDSLFLSGADSRGRHSAINYLTRILPKPEK